MKRLGVGRWTLGVLRTGTRGLERVTVHGRALEGNLEGDSPDVPALKSMRAIALDIGNQDPCVGTNTQLGESLARLDVAHTFEVYDGDHGNRIRERFESQVLRFFSHTWSHVEGVPTTPRLEPLPDDRPPRAAAGVSNARDMMTA